jgi:hypothetical protein
MAEEEVGGLTPCQRIGAVHDADMKAKAIAVLLLACLTAQAAPLNYVAGRWEFRSIFNDGREVVQWNYNHAADEHVVIEVRLGDEWVTPLSNYDGPTSSAAYTARNGMFLTRARFMTAEERQTLDNVLWNKAGEVERSGRKVFDYALNNCGQLVTLSP